MVRFMRAMIAVPLVLCHRKRGGILAKELDLTPDARRGWEYYVENKIWPIDAG
jgi:hypothetical protein